MTWSAPRLAQLTLDDITPGPTGSKRFALWASSQLELRVEAFNLLNRSNFRAPNGNRSSVAFGTITATYDPRIVQVAAKFSF